MKFKNILLLMLIIFIISCTAKKTQDIFLETTDGMTIEFAELKSTVYDGGKDPFDIVIKLENKGEMDVNEVSLSIEGIKPQEFNKLEEEFSKKIKQNIKRATKDKEDNNVFAPPFFMTIKELNHITPIEGDALTFPITAKICYPYETRATTNICVRKNLLTQDEGICYIEEEKTTRNTGGPVQVENFKEMQRGDKAIGFSFAISHKGTGSVYDKENMCGNEKNKGRVYVNVETGLKGLTCTGLQSQGKNAEGYITLLNNYKEISCTQEIPKRKDYEKDVKITTEYKYEQTKTSQITVKHFESEQ